ncbi:alpha/beta fold hydrolase [Leptolyngbya sp. FACHB-261]|uniref:alpha/beta fold hydrolase n=1 Tax=Leptolyngbya sp. FACHB-261 TaxID=2692806 RepID=UPI00168320A0|nr:alpha/beta fold hydrolase [Leptolyngbya sp. FACHB-261]MBD2104047.1 alpha/beta fold hydrolase [Leptolyngbya sp. FACHB-261]
MVDLFTLKDFRLESGIVLPQVQLAYQISGKPNGSLPILTCTAFSQTYDDLAYLRRPGLALDPEQNWLIHTELLGNGRSSSPSNLPPPFAGPDFPAVTIRDNVRLQAALLDQLGVAQVQAVIGASMGGQQAIQWAVSYPERVQKAVVIVGSCRTHWHGQLFLHSLANCIQSDPKFNNGRYITPPLVGLSRMSEAWAPWAFSPEFYALQAYQNYEDTCAGSLEDFLSKWRTRYHLKDANNLLCHLQTWATHDVALTPGMEGSLEQVLVQIKARVLFLPSRTDAYFAISDVAREAALIAQATVAVIESISGHAAGFGRALTDRKQINVAILDFLAE